MAESGVIYALADASGIRYCGKTVRALRARLRSHILAARRKPMRHVSYWINSLASKGKEPTPFVLEAISFAGLSLDDQRAALNAAERRWIARLREQGCDLTNATDGGDGTHGRRHSPETVEAIRRAHLGRRASATARAAMSAGQKARDKSTMSRGPRHGEKIKRFCADNPNARRAAAAKIVYSPETLEKMSTRHRGSKNVNAKLSDTQVIEIFKAQRGGIKLARQYSVSDNTVLRIRSGQSHRWLTETIGG